MWDHLRMAHGPNPSINPQNDFSFSVISSFKDPMTRQITEAVQIQMALGSGTYQGGKNSKLPVISLNRKTEYFSQRNAS